MREESIKQVDKVGQVKKKQNLIIIKIAWAIIEAGFVCDMEIVFFWGSMILRAKVK